MTDASGHRPDHPLAQPLALARQALAHAPAGLLCDLDGTLAPIVADPGAARPLPEAMAALTILASRLAVVGVVTGRAAGDARRLLATDRLLVIGNHGLEWLEPGSDEARLPAELEWVAQAVREITARVPVEPGVWIEPKGLSATVHYRSAPDPAAAADRLREALGEAPALGLTVRPGRMSFELRAAGGGDKGTALQRAVARHALRGLLVMGDDVTDLDMFRSASDARAGGRLAAAILAVGGAGEVPPSVAAAADAVLADPQAVAQLLSALAAEAPISVAPRRRPAE
jgi:trehalose 6-phosphate phosphatase